jgi:hypothetical protein
VPCDRERPEIPPERDRRRVRITAPIQDQAFRIPLSAPIPLEFQVDAPDDAFRRPGDAVELRIVAEDGNRALEPPRQFAGDRQATIRLHQLTAQGEMQIDAGLGDFKIPLATGGLRNMKVRIVAELLLAKRDPAENRAPARDSVRVVLDGAPPVFDIDVPGRAVTRGESVPVSARVTDELSGVEKMEFGFDLENADELSKKPEPIVVRQPSGDESWRTALPTKDLEPGQYRVLVRATDRVGYAGKQQKLVTIGPAAVVVGEKAPPAKTSDIKVLVTDQDGRPPRQVRVTLRETSQVASMDSDGRFTFKGIPHGKYTIEAKGLVAGSERKSSKEIVLPASKEPAEVEIRLEF